MNLDDFAGFRISISTDDNMNDIIILRHENCPDRWFDRIKLERPLHETNLKWLMVKVTAHWQDSHRQD